MARSSDAPAIAAIYAPIVLDTPICFELVPPDAAAFRERLAEVLRHAPWLVLEQAGAIAGYAYASRHRARPAYLWSVDVSVYVAPTHHRQGVARTLYEPLFALLAAQGFCSVYAGVTLPNVASIALHEALGFHPVGVYERVGYKLGAWRDVGWWQRALRPYDVEPTPPRLWPDFVADLTGREQCARLAVGLDADEQQLDHEGPATTGRAEGRPQSLQEPS